jgi:hypothetical protein
VPDTWIDKFNKKVQREPEVEVDWGDYKIAVWTLVYRIRGGSFVFNRYSGTGFIANPADGLITVTGVTYKTITVAGYTDEVGTIFRLFLPGVLTGLTIVAGRDLWVSADLSVGVIETFSLPTISLVSATRTS